MQHDHIQRKLNFVPQLYSLCSPRGSNQGLQTKIPSICFMSIIPLPTKRLDRFGTKIDIDLVIEKFIFLLFIILFLKHIHFQHSSTCMYHKWNLTYTCITIYNCLNIAIQHKYMLSMYWYFTIVSSTQYVQK